MGGGVEKQALANRPWILSWNQFHGPARQCEPEPFPHQTKHYRKPTCKSQTWLLNSPAFEAHTHPGAGAFIPAKDFFTAFIQALPHHSDTGQLMCPTTLHIYHSLVTKRQASLASSYSLLCRIFQAPNPSLLAQDCPLSLFNGRCHLLILLKPGMVWPPHSSKLEMPSFTQKAWKMLWFTPVLMSWGLLDLWVPAASAASANSTAMPWGIEQHPLSFGRI